MSTTEFKKFTACQKIRHFICLLLISSSVLASGGRFPASGVPEDNFDTLEIGTLETWYDQMLIEDRKGVMRNTRDSLNEWREIEEFREAWGITFTGMYQTPDVEFQKSFIKRQAIRYLDKRIFGSLKHAKKGSALHRVNAVQQALKPKAEASISKHVKLKFKARVLQGEGIIRVDNPWVDCNARVRLNGNMEAHIGRRFASLGVETSVDYRKQDGIYIAAINKQLTGTIRARVSSIQNPTTTPFSDNSDSRLEFFYSRGF